MNEINWWAGGPEQPKPKINQPEEVKLTEPQIMREIREIPSLRSGESRDNLERRQEQLWQARESIIQGSSLHIIDDIDIFACEYIPAGRGPLQVVFNGAVVGYAKENPAKYKREIKFT
jgi:hypothetical protein